MATNVLARKSAKHPGARVHVSGTPIKQVSTRVGTTRSPRRVWRLQVSRPAPYLGHWHVQSGTPLFACTELASWETVAHGAALRALGRESSCGLRGERSNPWHIPAHPFTATGKCPMKSCWKCSELMVAGAESNHDTRISVEDETTQRLTTKRVLSSVLWKYFASYARIGG